jgi:DnaJ-class molecular chaperone
MNKRITKQKKICHCCGGDGEFRKTKPIPTWNPNKKCLVCNGKGFEVITVIEEFKDLNNGEKNE